MRFVRACPTHFSSSQHRQECADDRGAAEAERCSYGVEALPLAASWTVTEHRERGASITIDLNIAGPWGTAGLDTYSVQAIDFDVTDRLGTQEAESSGLSGVRFSGLTHRLLTELGLPTRRGEDRMRWDLSTVVVTAYRGKWDNFVNIASPQYRAEEDQIDECIVN